MNKAELESKHLSDLHALAAEAGIERFRMLSRGELIEKLSGGGGGGGPQRSSQRAEQRTERPRRDRQPRDRSRGGRGGGGERSSRQAGERKSRQAPERKPAPEPKQEPEPAPRQETPAPAAEPARPRRRRRRRFGRRGRDTVTIQDLLLPPEAGRQTILYAESRAACTALLRGVAADLAGASKGPDPVALLIDPSPEELADWKREAPQAEIVAAGQSRHAGDAVAQASARAAAGEDVILLVDSLTRLATEFGEADAAKQIFDAGRATTGSGTLTVVAALEKQ